MAFLNQYVSSVRKSNSFWALADQSVLSLGTFATTFALMRAYAHDHGEFGVFGLIISTLWLLNNLHASIITYPLSVLGAAMPIERLRSMASSSLLLTALLSIPLILAMLVATIVLKHTWLFPFVAMALLAGQIQETTRRALMAHLRHNEAIWGDAISYLGQAAIVIGLCYHRVPQLHEIFLVMAGTSLLAAFLQAMQLKLGRCTWPEARKLAVEGWILGRWLLLSNGLNLITIQAVGWVIMLQHGAEIAAAYYALSQLLGVSHPVMFGISGLIVPGVARAAHDQGPGAARAYAVKLGAIGFGMLAPYYLFLLIVPALAIRVVAGPDSPYIQYTTDLRWFVLQYVMLYISVVTTGLLNGLQLPRQAFYGQLANAGVSAAVRLPLSAISGLTAAMWSGIVTYAVHVAVNLMSLRSIRAESAPKQPVGVLALEA